MTESLKSRTAGEEKKYNSFGKKNESRTHILSHSYALKELELWNKPLKPKSEEKKQGPGA